MRRHGSIFFTLAALVGLSLSAAPPASARGHHRRGEGRSGGESGPRRINRRDPDAVGWVTFTGNAGGSTPAIWPNGASTPTLLPGNPFGEATSINNKGTVTGTLFDNNQATQAFAWTQANGLQMLGPGVGLVNNDSDEIFGAAPHNGTFEAAKWVKPGQPPVFLGLGGGVQSQISTADIYGNAAGFGLNADGSVFGFEVLNGKYTRLPGLGGPLTFVSDINNLGIAVGAASLPDGTVQSVYWDAAGGIHNLKAPGGTGALAVADNGVVVVGMPDGLHLMPLGTPGVIGPPLGIFPTPEFLNIGAPFNAGINDLGDVSGVDIVNGNDYHAVISSPESTPLAAAAATSVGTALKGAIDLVTKLQKSAPPGTTSSTWLDERAGIYSVINDLLTLQRGQTSLSSEQTGQLIYGLSNSLALDSRGGPNGAPDPSVVSPEQLQQLKDADTQALKAAGGDPNVTPTF
jgi:hypothetical protein